MRRRRAERVLRALEEETPTRLSTLGRGVDLVERDTWPWRRSVLTPAETSSVLAAVVPSETFLLTTEGTSCIEMVQGAHQRHGSRVLEQVPAQSLVEVMGERWVQGALAHCCPEADEVGRTLLLDGWTGSCGELTRAAAHLTHREATCSS